MKKMPFLTLIRSITLFITSCIITSCAHKDHYQASLYPPLDPAHQADYESKGSKVMIATQGKYATDAGLKMYDLGGNIFDAFVAISFVISVERPQSTGLGGGGFLVMSSPKMPNGEAWDFREMAPKKATQTMYLDSKGEVIKNLSFDGMKAVGVPGLVAGVLEIHKKYGKLPLRLVLAPAIELALKGFPVYQHLYMNLVERAEVMKSYPATKKIFFHADGTPLKMGEILVQKDLARTMMKISSHGRAGFYEGEIGKRLVATSKKYGGLMTAEDLSDYKVKIRPTLQGEYKGYKIITMPPPSSGGVHILQILNTLSEDNLKSRGPVDPQNVHVIASAMQRAFADRAEFMGDPDFNQIPVDKLTNKSYAKYLRSTIQEKKATPMSEVKPGQFQFIESSDTTHFTIIDSEGNMIASTQTINGHFGSGIVAAGTGVVMNNEMNDFASKVGASDHSGAIGGKNNLIEPGKRPLSSMSPTLVFKDGKPLMALGTPSGTHILTCVTNVLLNYLEYGLPLYESVAMTRIHQQWSPDEIRMDESGFPKATLNELKKYGHKVRLANLGCQIQAATFENGILHGVSDPRGEGRAFGR
ncbi:MAG: gamma-glutamyltransferase [Bacteriovoracaceae bacterium]